LRDGHGDDDRQGNERSGAGDGFPEGDQLAKDIAKVNDAARSKFWTAFGMALCLMKNYDPFQSPTHFKMTTCEEVRQNSMPPARIMGKLVLTDD